MNKEIDMQASAKALHENKAFLDLMRGLFAITAFDSFLMDGADLTALSKANGKREVWGQLKAAMDLPQETISKIEHFKLMKDD